MDNALVGDCDLCSKLIMSNHDWRYKGDELLCGQCAMVVSVTW